VTEDETEKIGGGGLKRADNIRR